MRTSSRLPSRLPEGSKYVLESRGSWVQRYVEFPDGRRVRLRARKALPCCAADVTLVPKLAATAAVPRPREKHNSASKRHSRVAV